MSSTVTIRILGDPSGANAALASVDSNMARFSSKMTAIGGNMRNVGRKMSLGLTLPIAAGLALSFKAASDLNESLSKTAVIFKRSADEVKRWSKTSAEAMGLSRSEAIEGAANFGNMFNTIGLGTKQSAKMSMSMTQLAADLGSLNNQDPSEMLDRLRSGLAGEAEPLRRFGVLLSAAEVQAFAYRSGIAEVGAELTEAQKVQARYGLILEQTKTAQGDFGRTADQAANQQRILAAKFKDTAAVLGQQLLPIGIKIMGWVSNLVERFEKLSPEMQKFIVIGLAIVAALGPVIYVLGAVATAIGFLLSPVGLVILAIVALIAAVVLIWKNWDTIWNAIKEHPALAAITAAFFPFIAMLVLTVGAVKYVYENWKTIWTQIKDVAQTVWDAIKGYVLAGVQIVTGVVNFALAVLQGRWGDAWRAMLQVLSGIWAFIKQAVSDGVTQTVSLIASLPGRIFSIASGFGNLLVGAGRALMDGLLRGIKQAWENVKDFVGGIAGKLVGLKGPPEYDATVLVNNGQLIMQGLQEGMERDWAKTAAWLKTLGPEISGAVNANVGVPNLLPAGVGAGGGTVFNIDVTVNGGADGQMVGAKIVDEIKKYERKSGTTWRTQT